MMVAVVAAVVIAIIPAVRILRVAGLAVLEGAMSRKRSTTVVVEFDIAASVPVVERGRAGSSVGEISARRHVCQFTGIGYAVDPFFYSQRGQSDDAARPLGNKRHEPGPARFQRRN
jgi:hypothetical protein